MATPGGHIPTLLPDFDLYCVGPCGPMSVLLTYLEVSEISGAGQLVIDPISDDQVLRSGGIYPTTDVRIYITTSVPDPFTLDFTLLFQHLPTDFTSLVSCHAFLGTTDAAGPCAGLFFSKTGLLYAGAIHHTGGGVMVLDSSLEALPNSQLLVSENEYWSVRIASSSGTGATFIYVTKTADLPIIGHQLRYIVPTITANALSFSPTDRTTISVAGTLAKPVSMQLDEICSGTGLVIPGLPPTANPGLDQALRMCSIAQLDGTGSSDPQNALLQYQWLLVDAPLGSQFIFDGLDGSTLPLPVPTGFTNKFYSPSLASVSIAALDVLVVAGLVYLITGTGTDLNGFFLTVDGFVLPDSIPRGAFKVLPQNGISGKTTVKPTFYPDTPGLYKFNLTVFNGVLHSEPAEVIVNVTESPIPRGCIPDLAFLWNYLSNFWNLLEDKERITLFWGATAQAVASELLRLWQIDYSKSLRDVPRTFVRRWLHYDPLLTEPLPNFTKFRVTHQGCRSNLFNTTGTSAYAGTVVTLSSPALATPLTITIPGGSLNIDQMQAVFQTALSTDTRFSVEELSARAPSTDGFIRVDAAFPFTLTQTGTPFFAETNNSYPHGTSGVALGVRSYRADRSLRYLDIKTNDLLCLGSEAYRVSRVTDDPTDVWPFQRVTLLDDLPSNPTSSWAIPGTVTSTDLDFYSELLTSEDTAHITLINADTGLETLFDVQVLGAAKNLSSVLPIDTLAFGHLLLQSSYAAQLLSVRRHGYIPINELIADIPYLQDRVQVLDDSTVLRRNIDFFINDFRGLRAIQFNTAVWDEAPPDIIWAETTYLDNRPVIEQNFGLPASFTLDNLSQLPTTIDYLSAVRGLWYSYFNGPTLFNLRVGAQILLGLPFAEEQGVLLEIRNDFSVTHGRILMQDVADQEIVRAYSFPVKLSMETNPATGVPYVVGDTVQQFAPLVTGVEVVDWVKDPTWFKGYLNQGVFFEIEKFHRFLVRVNSLAFNLPALLFVKSFILRIKPTYTFPLFVVAEHVTDAEVSTTDEIKVSGRLLLFDGACFNHQTVATMFDDPRPAVGGWVSRFDTDDSGIAPTFPNPEPVYWGFDKELMCPEDYLLGTASTTFIGLTYPPYDSLFAYDTPLYTKAIAIFEDSWVGGIPITGDILFDPVTAGEPGTIQVVDLVIVGDPGGTAANYKLIISNNGFDEATLSFTELTTSPFTAHFSSVGILVSPGDVLSARIVPGSGTTTRFPFWYQVVVTAGTSVMWAFDTQLPAGTYTAYKSM